MEISIREVPCPSGAVLKIRAAPFADAKNLLQALLREVNKIKVSSANLDKTDLLKELFTVGYSSPEIEAYLWKCLERCTYTGIDGIDSKIDKDSFEPVECRQDYMKVCMEVATDAVSPFFKSLVQEFESLIRMVDKHQA